MMRFVATAIAAIIAWLTVLHSADGAAMPPLNDFAKSLSDVAGGIFTSLPSMFPSSDTVLAASKNLFVGYPVEAVISAVHLFCAFMFASVPSTSRFRVLIATQFSHSAGSSAISASSVQPQSTPASEAMNFVLMTRDHNVSIPLREPDKLWRHAHFNTSRPTVVMVTGWTSNINKSNSALSLMYEAFMCRGGVNFVVSVVRWGPHDRSHAHFSRVHVVNGRLNSTGY